jgi:predicted nucleic acid-binding protein
VNGKTAVIDASPLILLGKLRRLDLLENLLQNVFVPAAVYREIETGTVKDNAARLTLAWADSRRIADIEIPGSIAGWDLGPGESQVLAHCLDKSCRALLDDGKARACAITHAIKVTGVLGIVLRAKQQGLIPAARPIVMQLLALGSFLGEELIERSLTKAGE